MVKIEDSLTKQNSGDRSFIQTKRLLWKLKRAAWKLLNSREIPKHSTPYYSLEEFGQKGRCSQDFSTRFAGLEPLCNSSVCQEASLLDLGCAEGLISREFSKHGVRLIHGFDIQETSIQFANEVFAKLDGDFFFRQGDLGDWETFVQNNYDLLRPSYDIVLFLGVYHQIHWYSGKEAADRALKGALSLCKTYFAVRTDAQMLPDELFAELNFSEIEQDYTTASDTTAQFGPLRLFQRITS
jgi:SAM-dependent methyltransferase